MRDAVLEWANSGGLRTMPWRETTEPFGILVAEVLLQRTPWWKVSRIWPEFVARYPSASMLAAAEEKDLADLIRPLGLPKRASTLRRLGAALVETHNGVVPREVGALRKLPGVGEYVAAAV